MKKILLLSTLFVSFLAFSQSQLSVTKNEATGFDESSLREKMKNDGLSSPVIDKLIAQRKELFEKGKNVEWTQVKKNPVVNAVCSDMSVENGWASWMGDVGTANAGNQTWTPPPVLPTTPNFSITSGAGIDANTPGTSPGDPPIPFVCPNFGNQSILLGEPCVAGCVAEQLTYPLTVTVQDTSFFFAYAIVIEDAGHAASDQPFVEFGLYDTNGNPIPNGYFKFTAGPSMPGFYYVNGAGCGWGGTDQYKPWTIVGVNLAAYVGQTLTAVITNVDCAQCGHWAYSFWDFSCGSTSLFVNTTSTPDTCSTSTGTATANIIGGTPPYTYLWSNGQTTQTATGLSAGSSYTITVTDSNSVVASTSLVINNSMVAAVSSVTSVTCFGGNNGSASANVTGGIPPFAYLWSNGQTTQIATGLTVGTYTVVITDSTGCSSTITASVSGAPMLVSNVNYTPASCWNCPDGSAVTNAIGGTAPYTYYWFPGGQVTPNITGVTPGTYVVCIYDQNGCTQCDTIYVLYLGVNEVFSESISIFPNPSSGNISIDFGAKNFGKAEISVNDAIGKILFETKITATGKQALDVSALSEGIYFLHLKTNDGIATKKIVISK